MSENTSFAFVANLVNINCDLPFKIIEDCYFQKANPIQIEQIKQYLQYSGYFPNYSSYNSYPYEFVYVETINTLNHKSFQGQPLEPQDWKYYVINFSGNNSKISDLSLAANLTEVELEFGLQFLYHEGIKHFGIQKKPTHTFHYFHEMNSGLPSTESIYGVTLQDIGSIYQNYQQLDEIKYPDIKKAINKLEELKHLPHNSEFKILGLFTIIEFLITHKSIDTGDSITRQVINKINLLSKRFSKKLDYYQFFGNTPESTLWKKLYAYRSNIAHGGQPDFAKELLVLKDDFTAKKFLKLVVKMLLQHSLIEPQLYTDLREC
ncbi:HEPN domain-containing protein [Nostoc sp. NMS9]|uniref:HEPN domain-containing protein n=1 Tax=Nostoc sp. NMS9 TaxID=2815393 RepID=UPI0025EED0DF|nr:HEPN domain-containing protein [Nostoc sp. NMS9]MBN3942987.1 hypothetical protein [Nostoc sp. NMS9]